LSGIAAAESLLAADLHASSIHLGERENLVAK